MRGASVCGLLIVAPGWREGVEHLGWFDYIAAMAQPVITIISSVDFNKEPQRYLDQVAAGQTVEITGVGDDPVVLMPKSEFEGYQATAELLEHPADREAFLRSLAELKEPK